MLTGKLPYRDGFTNARSISRLTPVAASTIKPAIPTWASTTLAKATHREPNKRYDALSAFMFDLSRPNTSLERAEARPLMERNPLLFWKVLAFASIVINLGLLYFLARG